MSTSALAKYDFLILAGKRSGSHMLATMLNSHPDLSCEGEWGRENDTVNIHASETGLRGCIIHYRQLRKIQAPKHIHLIRDPKANAVSLARTKARQTNPKYASYPAHYVIGDEPRNHEIVPNDKDVARILRNILRQRLQANDWFKATGKRLLTVSYESITNNQSVSAMPWRIGKEICSFLGVPYRRMTTHFIKGTVE